MGCTRTPNPLAVLARGLPAAPLGPGVSPASGAGHWAPALTRAGLAGTDVEKPLTSTAPCVCSIWGFFHSFFQKTFFPSLNQHFKSHSKPHIKVGACTRPGWTAAAGLCDCHPPLTRTNGACSHPTPCLSSFLSLSLIYSTLILADEHPSLGDGLYNRSTWTQSRGQQLMSHRSAGSWGDNDAQHPPSSPNSTTDLG